MSKSDKEERSFLRFALIASAVFVLFLFLKRDNIITWIGAGFTLHKQEKQIESLTESNEDLDKQIQKLSTNKDSLEQYAREHYHFAVPGEDVYIVK